MPIYNSHIHVFSSKCAPERFLDVALPEWADFAVSPVKGFLETWLGNKIMKSVAARKMLGKYASFINIGLNANQHDVFEHILRNCGYNPDTRFVILTLNMDHMGAGVSEMVFEGQVKEVAKLRAKYPSQVLPFLGLDPRAGDNNLRKLISSYIFLDAEKNHTGAFIGMKFYPALGYFPFDKRLEMAYDKAAELDIPLMTHCTKTGSYYVGKRTVQMAQPLAFTVNGEIPDFGEEFKVNGKGNDMAESAAFGHPRAWRYVLEADGKTDWKKLKICFAHMGGSNEFFSGRPGNWLRQILGMMCRYENTYTDISYILSHKVKKSPYVFYEALYSLLTGAYFNDPANFITDPWSGEDISVAEVKNRDEFKYWKTIPERILFGTDFYMTEQEGSESSYAHELSDWLIRRQGGNVLWDNLSVVNPARYLSSKVYTP